MARSNRKRRQAGMKFDGYIFFWGGDCVLVLQLKRKKEERLKRRGKKNKEKVFKMGHF